MNETPIDAREALVVLITAPPDRAAGLARQLVEEQLIGCANVISGVRSIYRWKGEICDDAECLLVCKTTRARLDLLKWRVGELHPYEAPEVLAVGVDAGAEKYLAWLFGSVAP